MSKTIKVIIKNDIHPVNFKLKYNFLFHRVNVSTIRGGWQHSHLDEPIKSGTTYRNNIKALCIPGPLIFVPMDGNKVNVILTVQVQVTSVQILGLLMLSVHTGSATTPWMSCTTADHHQQSTMIDIGEIKSPPLNFQ